MAAPRASAFTSAPASDSSRPLLGARGFGSSPAATLPTEADDFATG
jgi:hypothetical protein